MAGPFRIRYVVVQHPRPMESHSAALTLAVPPFESYLDRLMRMIPGEVVALYLVGSGLIPPTGRIALTVWSFVCLAGVIVIRAIGSRDSAAGKGPQWSSVAISAIAFVIWLYSLGGPFAAFGIYVPYIGSLLILAWTFFIPLFFKGEAVTDAPER